MPKKLSQEEFITRAEATWGDHYLLDKVQYKSMHEKITVGCRKHGYFSISPNMFFRGGGCKKCAFETVGNKLRSTKTDFLEKARKVHKDRYILDKVQYTGAREKVEIVCREHGPWLVQATSFLSGCGCPKCAGTATTTQQEFLERVREVHGEDKYDFSEAEYVNLTTNVKVVCRVHGVFWITPGILLRGSGCRACGIERISSKQTMTQQEFLERAIEKWGGSLDFSKVLYEKSNKKIEIICPSHGIFWSRPNNILQGYGCPKCGFETTANKKRRTQEDFIQKAYDVHGEQYDLSSAVYGKTGMDKVQIICKQHGPFEIKPSSFLKGHGCPQCAIESTSGKLRLAQEEFIQKARRVHGNKFDLSRSKYGKNSSEKVEVICHKHGSFFTSPSNFLMGCGCPRCSTGRRISKGEDRIAEFIKSLYFEVQQSNRTILRPLELDIYIPEKKLAIEYNGVRYHNDQMKDRNYHYNKYRQCRDQGIRLIQIMDIIWNTRQEQVKSLLRHALGVTDGPKLDARKCQVQEVKIAQLKAFFEQNHIQGHVHTAKVALALVYEGEIVAGMSLGKGTNQRGKAREGKEAVWTLSRYATSCLVRGGFQKLLKHGRQIIGMDQSIVTYSMNDYFSGNMYAQAGFRMDGEVAPDYQVYHYRCGLKPKSHWQRRNIPARLEEIGWEDTFDPNTDERTEWEVENEVGALRIWDSGKTRWLLEKQKCAT